MSITQHRNSLRGFVVIVNMGKNLGGKNVKISFGCFDFNYGRASLSG